MTEELNGGCLDEREAFEAWIVAEGYDGKHWLQRWPVGDEAQKSRYVKDWVQTAWEAWQKRASLSTSKQAGGAEGWQLVPIEPTAEMIEAAGNTPGMQAIDSASATHQLRGNPLPAAAFADGSPLHQAYRAMLAAAPSAPNQPGEQQ